MLAKREKMSKDNPRAVKITEALTQYIALDDQPLSVVDNVGFQRLLSILELRWWAAFAVHVFEAFVALKVCSNKGINTMTTRYLWFLQTFLFGFASLGLLLGYDPKRPKQH